MDYRDQQHNPQDNPRRYDDDLQTETAAEITPDKQHVAPDDTDRQVEGTGIGVTALILSLLAFFFLPVTLSIAGIIVGFFGVRKGSAAGWWAIGIGAFVLLMRILAFPLFVIF
jgi:hypothetical protein